MCKAACLCLHGETGYPRADLLRAALEPVNENSLLRYSIKFVLANTLPTIETKHSNIAEVQYKIRPGNTIRTGLDIFFYMHSHRVRGPFRFVAQSYRNILSCVNVWNEIPFLFSPIEVHDKWELSSCTRVVSSTSGNQLHLGNDGVLRLQDRAYNLGWNSTNRVEERTVSQYSLSIRVIESKKAQLQVSSISPTINMSIWNSVPFPWRPNELLHLSIDNSRLCVRLSNSIRDVWSVCDDQDIDRPAIYRSKRMTYKV